MEESYRVNVIAPHLLTLILLPELKKTADARVLFVSSRAGDCAVPGAVTYSCTKAALDHLAMNMDHSLAGEVAIGTLHPGEVDTDMQGDLRLPSEEQLAVTTHFRQAKTNNQLISSTTSAQFMVHLLYDTPLAEYSTKKWDIYFDRPSTFPDWLSEAIGTPPPYLKPIHKMEAVQTLKWEM